MCETKIFKRISILLQNIECEKIDALYTFLYNLIFNLVYDIKMNKKGLMTFAASAGTFVLSIPRVMAEGVSWAPQIVSGDRNVYDFIGSILNLLLFIVVVAAVLYITLAGFKYISSQGDPGKAKEAQAAITNAVIGLIVAFAAYFLVQLVLSQLGASIEDFNTIDGSTGE